VTEITYLLKHKFQDKGYKVLAYTEELMDLPPGSWIMVTSDMFWSLDPSVLSVIGECVPVSKNRTIFQIADGIPFEQVKATFLNFNTQNEGFHSIKKILDSDGHPVAMLFKERLDTNASFRARDLPPPVAEDVAVDFDGVDEVDRKAWVEWLLNHGLQAVRVTGNIPEGEMGYMILESKASRATVIRFDKLHTARIFYLKFSEYHCHARGRLVVVKLQNSPFRHAIQSNLSEAMMLRSKPKVARDELERLFIPRIMGGQYDQQRYLTG
jgi:hypothetical protein